MIPSVLIRKAKRYFRSHPEFKFDPLIYYEAGDDDYEYPECGCVAGAAVLSRRRGTSGAIDVISEIRAWIGERENFTFQAGLLGDPYPYWRDHEAPDKWYLAGQRVRTDPEKYVGRPWPVDDD